MRKFDLAFSRTYDEISQWQIDIHDESGEWVAQVVGEDFGNALRHALFLQDEVLAAQVFPDYFEWAEKHKIEGTTI